MRTSLPRAKLTADVGLREPPELDWLRRQQAQSAALDALKTIKLQLASEASAIERMLHNKAGTPQPFVLDCLRCRGIARRRALHNAELQLRGAIINGERDLLDIRWLAPHDHLIAQPQHRDEYQSNITTHICLIWPDTTSTFTVWSRWLLEASTNALGRFLQFSKEVDLRGALLEAAAAYAAADCNVVFANPTSLYLRAGHGVFVADLIKGQIENSDCSCLYVRAHTWLSDKTLGERQQPLPAAKHPANSIATLLLRQARSKDHPSPRSQPSRTIWQVSLNNSQKPLALLSCWEAREVDDNCKQFVGRFLPGSS
jgi:hypothetical protein